jgi:hypothetical protein
MKARRVERSLKDNQMLQAPMTPTASADPNVAILKNHSILSDFFIVSHCDYSIASSVSIVVKGFTERLERTKRLERGRQCARSARYSNFSLHFFFFALFLIY